MVKKTSYFFPDVRTKKTHTDHKMEISGNPATFLYRTKYVTVRVANNLTIYSDKECLSMYCARDDTT